MTVILLFEQVVQALSRQEALDLAMKAFSLDQVKVIHSEVTDTQAVLAWGQGRLVLAFRGTQSMTDACTDAQASKPNIPRPCWISP